MSRKLDIETAVETAWKILEGLGYKREKNPQLREAVNTVFWSAPYEEEKGCTAYGYPIDWLLSFGLACRKAGVEEDDLRKFARSYEAGVRLAMEDFNRQVREMFGDLKGKGENHDL